jgi:hypothetical protein
MQQETNCAKQSTQAYTDCQNFLQPMARIKRKYFGPCTSMTAAMNNLGIHTDPSKMNVNS